MHPQPLEQTNRTCLEVEEEDGGEGEEEKRRALETVFGESSSECDEENQFSTTNGMHLHAEEKLAWERVEEIKGLWLCREFLSTEKQCWLLAAIEQEGWFTDSSHNQAMRFGDLPEWAIKICTFVRDAISVCGDLTSEDQYTEEACPLPFHLLWREPLFDQLIVNTYEPGEGICAHVDLMRFDDGIAVISLQSACLMHFTAFEHQAGIVQKEAVELGSTTRRIPVLLTPGSLVLMSGEARYLWQHEINRKPGFQVWEGKELCQQKRTSVTLRKLYQPQ